MKKSIIIICLLGLFLTAAVTSLKWRQISDATPTVTEINFVDGVTSSIQTQLNSKAATAHSQAQSTITALSDSLLSRFTKAQSNLLFVKKTDLVDPTSLIDSLSAITTFKDITDNYTIQFSGTYTSTTNDLGKIITVTAATAKVITVPTNAVAPFPIGSTITIIQGGSGDVSIAGSGVTFKSESSWVKIGAQESAVQLIKISTDTWRIIGRLKA